MGNTTISWTNKTWGPIRGCSKVSPGCTHCYAERIAARFCGPGQAYEGTIGSKCKPCNGTGLSSSPPSDECPYCHGTGWDTKNGRWNGEVVIVAEHLLDPLRWRSPQMVFVNSMSDLFHEKLSNEEIAMIFVVMLLARRHTFQVLTKRAERMHAWFEWAGRKSMAELIGIARTTLLQHLLDGHARLFDDAIHAQGAYTWPAPNIWIGVSVENQWAANDRIPHLLACPAIVHFLSCEPLLERVELGLPATFLVGATAKKILRNHGARGPVPKHLAPPPTLEWVIAGCESGPGARSTDVDWLRQLRDDCARAGVPFFLKQATHSVDMNADSHAAKHFSIRTGIGSRLKSGGVVELPYLDGVQHAAFPEVER